MADGLLDLVASLRAALDLLDDEKDWPRNSKGQPKIFCSDAQADRWIKAGLATEDDLIRQKPLPVFPETDHGEEEGQGRQVLTPAARGDSRRLLAPEPGSELDERME